MRMHNRSCPTRENGQAPIPERRSGTHVVPGHQQTEPPAPALPTFLLRDVEPPSRLTEASLWASARAAAFRMAKHWTGALSLPGPSTGNCCARTAGQRALGSGPERLALTPSGLPQDAWQCPSSQEWHCRLLPQEDPTDEHASGASAHQSVQGGPASKGRLGDAALPHDSPTPGPDPMQGSHRMPPPRGGTFHPCSAVARRTLRGCARWQARPCLLGLGFLVALCSCPVPHSRFCRGWVCCSILVSLCASFPEATGGGAAISAVATHRPCACPDSAQLTLSAPGAVAGWRQCWAQGVLLQRHIRCRRHSTGRWAGWAEGRARVSAND